MKKGDATRQEILRIAEELFLKKGYDETSIQNILDVMHGSKGGFYHHFASKDEVLKTLCNSRADSEAEKSVEMLMQIAPSSERLNFVLQNMNPLQLRDASFTCMLFQLLDRQEGIPVRAAYQEAIRRAFLPMLRAEIDKGAMLGRLHPVVNDAHEVVALLVNDFWVKAALQMIEDADRGQRTEPAVLHEILTTYRRCIETILEAPYGSIELVSMEEWIAFSGLAFKQMRYLRHVH